MCGRYASETPPELLRQAFRTSNPLPNCAPRYNIAPTQDAVVVRFNPESRQRSLDMLRWGLIPHWAKDPKIGSRLINARAETVAKTPAFCDAFRRRRCLVPADAFYEWDKGAKPKQPYAIRRRDGNAMALAGLWENWRDPDGNWLRSFTIITTPADELVAPLHDRMPAIIGPDDYATWLGEDGAGEAQLLELLRPFSSEDLIAYRVGVHVNSVRNDGAALLEPIS